MTDAPLPAALLVGPMLDGLDLLSRKAYFQSLRTRRLIDGEVLFQEGASGDVLYIVADGCVVVTRTLRDGSILELDRVVSGDMVGAMAVISPSSRPGTAKSAGYSRVLRVDRASFRERLVERDAAAEALLRFATHRISRRLRQLDARIALAHDVNRQAPQAELLSQVNQIQSLGKVSLG